MSAAGSWKRQQEEKALQQKDPAAYARLVEMRKAAQGAADQFNTDVNMMNASIKGGPAPVRAQHRVA
jgi:hypothetical protein